MYSTTQQTLLAAGRSGLSVRLVRILRAVVEHLRAMHVRRVTEGEILKLNDNMLKDIGLSRDDVALGYDRLLTIQQERTAMIHGCREGYRAERR